MSFLSMLQLKSGKKITWLYRIRLGTQEEFLTSRRSDFVTVPDFFDRADFFNEPDFFSRTWSGSPTRHTKFRQSLSAERSECRVFVSKSNQMVQNIIADQGFNEAELTIYKTFTNDPDQEVVTVFRGAIQAPEQKWARVEFVCLNGGPSEFIGKAINQVVQRPCRWIHYHDGCGLNLADFQVAGTATAIADRVLTVTEAASQADGYYSGGIVQYGAGMAMIISHTGADLTLLGILPGLEDDITANGSASVSIAPGCDLSMGDCKDKFNNLLNHGGFPWISENPFDGRRIG